MEFKRRELRVNVYGEECKISFPTVKQSQGYAAKAREMGDEDATQALLGFLDELGLPKNIAEEMEPEHLTQIVNELIPSGKK